MKCTLVFMRYFKPSALGNLPRLLNNKSFMSKALRKPFCKTHPRHLKTIEVRVMTQEPQTCLDLPGDRSCPIFLKHKQGLLSTRKGRWVWVSGVKSQELRPGRRHANPWCAFHSPASQASCPYNRHSGVLDGPHDPHDAMLSPLGRSRGPGAGDAHGLGLGPYPPPLAEKEQAAVGLAGSPPPWREVQLQSPLSLASPTAAG